jgi:chitin disaccharide deacetylase
MKYLIVNADDFGFSKEINLGVCEAFLNGVVTDCSLLVRSPHVKHAINQAQAVGLSMGIHLDLVTPFVTTNSSCFGPNGNLAKILNHREYNGAYPGELSCADLCCIRNEMRAQVTDFIEMTGAMPTHLDYHYGLHYLPEVMQVYLTVADEFRLPARWGSQYAGPCAYKRSPNCFCDRFRGQREDSLNLLLQIIKEPWEQVMELICHPGYFTPWALPDSYNIEREFELQALTDPKVKQEIDHLNIRLICYDWLKQNAFESTRYKDG